MLNTPELWHFFTDFDSHRDAECSDGPFSIAVSCFVEGDIFSGLLQLGVVFPELLMVRLVKGERCYASLIVSGALRFSEFSANFNCPEPPFRTFEAISGC